ncbi:MAG: ribosome maturation factor RimM [Sandaracinaceae bacterium]|nr:ribosome maturation factor RimM [Sandaracinaceae bacterium]
MGRVVAHGLRGEVKVFLEHPDSTFDWVGVEVLFESKEGQAKSKAKVLSFRRIPKGVILRLDAFTDRTAAESVHGLVACVPREALPECDEGEVYLFDLLHLKVEFEGRIIGRVEDFGIYPTANTIVTRLEGEIIEIPVATPYVEEVDLRSGIIRVAYLEDLINRKKKRKK